MVRKPAVYSIKFDKQKNEKTENAIRIRKKETDIIWTYIYVKEKEQAMSRKRHKQALRWDRGTESELIKED